MQHVRTTLATLSILAISAPAGAQEVEMKNDSFNDGDMAAFQGGFVSGEEFASTFVPSGAVQVTKVRLLFGGATSNEDVTLRIYDDRDGTAAPGAPLYMGDYTLTGSNQAFSEIDISAQSVVVPGAFRVSFELFHDGFPGPARDADGPSQAGRNWINAMPGGWIDPALAGVDGDWVLRAFVTDSGGGGDPDAGVGGGDGGPGSGEACVLNSDCPNGQYCGDSDTCTFDCRLDIDCGGGDTCNAIGQCESGGGCGCQAPMSGGRGAGAALLALIALVMVRRRRRRRRG